MAELHGGAGNGHMQRCGEMRGRRGHPRHPGDFIREGSWGLLSHRMWVW